MHKLVKTIIRNKTRCVFVSPHPDDAIFSAGGLLSELAGRAPVKVINVFTTSGDNASTLSAKVFLRKCGAVSPQRLFEERKDEDRKALAVLKINPINMDKTDALWRKYESPSRLLTKAAKILPEMISLYHTYRFHVCSGRLNKQDEILVAKLAEEISKYLPRDGNYLIFSPLGIGGHVDHLAVRRACEGFTPKVMYWSDYPYLLHNNPDEGFIRENKLKCRKLALNNFIKLKLAKMYKTQYHQVIRDPGTLTLPEIYYL